MAQTFSGIRGEMEDIFEAVLREEPFNQRRVVDGAFDKLGFRSHIVAEAAGQIIQPHDAPTCFDQRIANMRTNETRRAGDKDSCFHKRLRFVPIFEDEG